MRNGREIATVGLVLLLGLFASCDSGKEIEKVGTKGGQGENAESKNQVRGVSRIPKVDLGRMTGGVGEEIQEAIEAVTNRPADAEAWGALGEVLHANEFETEAIQCYREATSLNSTVQKWWHLLGLLEFKQQPGLGIDLLRKAVRLEVGTNHVSRFKLAQVLAESGETQEVEEILKALLQADAHHSGARVELGRVWMLGGKLADAETILIRCLTNEFTARPAALLLSQLKARQGEESTAKALMERAQRMPRPFDWPDPFLHAVQRRKKNLGEKLDLIQQAIGRRSFEQAESLLESMARDQPENPEVWLMRGRLRLVQGRCENAKEALDRHLGLRPDSLNGHVQLGLALTCLENWELALQAFSNAVRLKPDFGAGHYNLGIVRSKKGDMKGAVSAFERALECDPGDLNILVALSEHLGLLGLQEQAIYYFEEAKRIYPSESKVKRLQQVLLGGANSNARSR